jgi:hypothetical protein
MFWENIKNLKKRFTQMKILTPNKQKLFPKNVLLKKKIGKPLLLYTGSDNPIQNTIKKGSFKKIIDKTIESKPIKWSKY